MSLADIYTLPVPLAGVPSISIPAGVSPECLPVGLQLTVPTFEEARQFAVAHSSEQATGHAAACAFA